MKRITMFALILFLVIGSMFTLGGCNDGKIDWDAIWNPIFDEVIRITIVAIEGELETGKADNVKFIMGWMDDWIMSLDGKDKLDKYLPGWRDMLKDVIGNAFDIVNEEAHGLMEAKLATREYEGADPIMHRVLEPDDFRPWFEEIMAPIK